MVVLGEQSARYDKSLDFGPSFVRLVCALKSDHIRMLGGGLVEPAERLTYIICVLVFTRLLAAQLLERFTKSAPLV